MRRFRIPRVNSIIRQLAYQVAGIVVLGAAEKYVPYPLARWAVYAASACFGVWYPITRAALAATHLDKTLEQI